MSIITSNLSEIDSIKEEIHTAIANKGVTIPNNTPFAEYPDKISAITGGGVDPSDIAIVKFNIDPYQITDDVTMHVTGAVSVYKNIALVEKGSSITYYASCDQYEDTTPQTVTVNSDMAILVTLHKTATIYGFSIDQTISNPSLSVSYIKGCDNENYIPAGMNFSKGQYEWNSWEGAFFVGKPCMLKSNGEVDYYLDPNDFTKKLDGTASDIADTSYDGNCMIEFPAIYLKRENVGTTINVYISNVKVDNDYEAWNCKRSDDTYNEHWYFAAYTGCVNNNIMRSLSNTTCTGDNSSTREMQYARANGAGWDVTWWADEDVLRMVFYLMHKGLNSQTLLGMGNTSYSATSGLCDNKGLCFGTQSYSTYGVKFLGIDNYYAMLSRRCNGLMMVNSEYKVKMTKGTQDGSSANDFNDNATGYLTTGVSCPYSDGWITQQTATSYGMLTNKIKNGSASTYYCDFQRRDTSGVRKALIGGDYYSGSSSGVSFVSFSYYPETTSASIGASLSYHKP